MCLDHPVSYTHLDVYKRQPLRMHEVKELMAKDAQVIDVRDPTAFAGGHIPKTLNIWKDGLPAYAGWFLNYDEPIIIIDDNNSNIDELRRHMVCLLYTSTLKLLKNWVYN